MIVQALVLIAVVAVIGGSILTSSIATTRASLHQALAAQSSTAMSAATADFVAWAQARVRANNARTSWAPGRGPGGRSDTTEFRPLCPGSQTSTSTPEPACRHMMYATWTVTGSTTAPPSGDASSGIATNMARSVDEQRIAAVISVHIESENGRHTYASTSREITARIFDASPYVVVTGVREIASRNGSISSAEGDSGGTAAKVPFQEISIQTPDPNNPSLRIDTRVITDVTCENTRDVKQSDPKSGTVTNAIEMNRDGNMDWHYELLCEPSYPTPAPTDIDVFNYIEPSQGIYKTIEGSQDVRWRTALQLLNKFDK